MLDAELAGTSALGAATVTLAPPSAARVSGFSRQASSPALAITPSAKHRGLERDGSAA